MQALARLLCPVIELISALRQQVAPQCCLVRCSARVPSANRRAKVHGVHMSLKTQRASFVGKPCLGGTRKWPCSAPCVAIQHQHWQQCTRLSRVPNVRRAAVDSPYVALSDIIAGQGEADDDEGAPLDIRETSLRLLDWPRICECVEQAPLHICLSNAAHQSAAQHSVT